MESRISFSWANILLFLAIAGGAVAPTLAQTQGTVTQAAAHSDTDPSHHPNVFPSMQSPSMQITGNIEHAGEQQTTAQSNASAVARPCVLLRNDSVLYGQATQLGNTIVVRRDDGTRINLPRSEVQCWGATLSALYEYKADHRNPRSYRELIRDARWCLRNGMVPQAALVIGDARRMIPADPVGKQLAEQITRAALSEMQRSNNSNKSNNSNIGHSTNESTIATVSHEQPAETPQHDANTLHSFTRHIQPVLLNRCIHCHTDRETPLAIRRESKSDSDSVFRLKAANGGARPSQSVSKENLDAVLGQLDFETPEFSPLILRAMDGHAKGKSLRLPVHQSVLATMKQWVSIAKPKRFESLPNSQSPDSQGLNQYADEISPNGLNPVSEIDTSQSKDTTSPQDDPFRRFEPVQPATSGTSESKRIARLPPVANPFDPDLFNRRYHGNK